MRAAVATAIPTRRLEQQDLPEPSPRSGELLVEIEACGICGTDLHILDGLSYRPKTPAILGHEPVGRVVAAGSDADAEWLGQRVTLTLFTGCGTCEHCSVGDERVCPDLVSIIGVVGAAGGFAERMLLRAAQAVRVPDSLTAAQAATLVDAGATAANAVRILERAPDGPLTVVGGGPVGWICAELARVAGWNVTVVQSSPVRREALQDAGVAVVARLEDVSIRPSVVIDAAGASSIAPWALEALRPRGLLVLAAYGVVDGFDMAPIARKELRIVGVRSGSRVDLERALGAAASGEIRLPPISTWTLSEIDDALESLRAKGVQGKAVIVPQEVHR